MQLLACIEYSVYTLFSSWRLHDRVSSYAVTFVLQLLLQLSKALPKMVRSHSLTLTTVQTICVSICSGSFLRRNTMPIRWSNLANEKEIIFIAFEA